ncbi:MAG: 4Fe-4S dicluster domain-containing protein [Pseudomonadales bacterium]|nr:4Fe-4S dicluster domain-containing protein [Pseudomonadales bacterium]
MLIFEPGRRRGVETGRYPLETLARDSGLIASESALNPVAGVQLETPTAGLAACARRYADIYEPFLDGKVASAVAPVPGDLAVRSRDIKGALYYLDAAHAGICRIPDNAWLINADVLAHDHAIVLMVEYGREPEPDNPAQPWLIKAQGEIARMRSCEIAVCIAGYLRQLGFAARAHLQGNAHVDLDRLAVMCGIAQRRSGAVHSPFFGNCHAIAAITTDYELACDDPLAADVRVSVWKDWWGTGGAVSGRERRRQQGRASHLSRYPMERVKRVSEPTTAILQGEIPRVPKRAAFFTRAAFGDLGPRAQREVKRFAYKHPLTAGMMHPLRALVPHQDGEKVDGIDPALLDAWANSRSIRSLAYHLGADLVGICEVPEYAWYSHHLNGDPIEPYHSHAVVMLIDQGFETMEGASGDDWISGCQSMRGYLRGAEIAGLMAEYLRGRGVSARPQTNADSDVLQMPLVLLAGLGELARIGELVLNPFVGPRFKSVVLTTDLPLIADDAVDFGLQYFCNHCRKCARECPVSAIPFGPKVMFNGYEMWKPDVERCTRYRVTNQKGSACGRCMKTCPLNKVVSADGVVLHRVANWLGINAHWLKAVIIPMVVKLDDWLGFGKRNAVKRWWLDLEVVGEQVVEPRATNERDIDPEASVRQQKSPVGYYHANEMPAPDAQDPVPVNHKDAVARAAALETPEQALRRYAEGGVAPSIYTPVTESAIEEVS